METIVIVTEHNENGEPLEAVVAHFIPDTGQRPITDGPPNGFNTFMRALDMPAFQGGQKIGGMTQFEMVLN